MRSRHLAFFCFLFLFLHHSLLDIFPHPECHLVAA
jgi:hypothetical protein